MASTHESTQIALTDLSPLSSPTSLLGVFGGSGPGSAPGARDIIRRISGKGITSTSGS